jgi:hypothetical protein
MGDSVEPDRMETGITEENLDEVFRRRISLFNGSNIFLKALPHR